MQEDHVNRMILFSIVVPIYETEAYLPKCIESILAQTYQNFELILVDDGSTDSSPMICDHYAQKDSRIHVIHKENGGSSSARNAGIHSVSGKYVMFVDSDDYWNDENALQSVAQMIAQYNCDLLCTNICKAYENTSRTKKYFSPTETLIGAKQVLLYERYVSSPCSKVICASLFRDNDLNFTEGVGSEDIDWSLRLALKAKHIVYVDLAFYSYVQRADSTSHNMTAKKIDDLKNNVYTCIRLLDELDDATQKLFRPYVSYQYAILLLNTATMLDKSARQVMLAELRSKECFLKYSASPKVQLMETADKLFGFNGMLRILSVYTRLKK